MASLFRCFLKFKKNIICRCYQGYKASIAIEDARLLAGELPPRQLRMVQVWIDLHREEFLADWDLTSEGVEPFRIDPLK
jgi:hypothetical protein